MVGHAAHGGALLRILHVPVPGGQRQIQLPGGQLRVLVEHLIKVAQAEEQQAVRVLLLDLVILLFHGRQLSHDNSPFLLYYIEPLSPLRGTSPGGRSKIYRPSATSPGGEARPIGLRPLPPKGEARPIGLRPLPPEGEARSIGLRPLPPEGEASCFRVQRSAALLSPPPGGLGCAPQGRCGLASPVGGGVPVRTLGRWGPASPSGGGVVRRPP